MALKYKPISIALYGKYYAFCGPKSNTGATPFPSNGYSDRHVAIGEGQSWFRHWHDENDRCWIQWSPNMKTEYPGLDRQLQQSQDSGESHGCPSCISFGPNGTYFANIGGWKYYSLPNAIKDEVDISDVDRLFLGRGSAYYVVYRHNGTAWKLGGNYSQADELSSWLKSSHSPAKAFAFNLVDSSWAVVLENGSNWASGGSEWNDYDVFDKWREANFH